ncbi:hypothetical protein PR202_gb24001 [Eleusine coracana subsp. coracana]|uniref:Uncharacterized protein n=1 Tax=Eleusine coracana subsp. coracana TaxID=191504 RepID=A0AAV5FLV0_ELECO|nr:hypothetical protein PR202_gb24001 [Eleusine coracana subsp. coracana]
MFWKLVTLSGGRRLQQLAQNLGVARLQSHLLLDVSGYGDRGPSVPHPSPFESNVRRDRSPDPALSKANACGADRLSFYVHDSWRVKLQEKWSGSSLEAYCQQVKRCTEIALKCVEVERQNRPNIVDIIHELNALQTAADEISHCPGGELLSVYPFQLVFPSVFESRDQMIACPLHLTNNTDDNIQFRLLIPRQQGEYTDEPNRDYVRFIGQLSGPVPPRTKLTSFLTLDRPWNFLSWSALPENGYEFFTLEFWRERHEDEVHQVKLLALYEPPGPEAENKTTTSEGRGSSSPTAEAGVNELEPRRHGRVRALSRRRCRRGRARASAAMEACRGELHPTIEGGTGKLRALHPTAMHGRFCLKNGCRAWMCIQQNHGL